MAILESKLNPTSPELRASVVAMRALVDDLRAKVTELAEGGGGGLCQMSSEGPETIVRMANDIGNFFRAETDRQVALDGISNHINKFWTRRMRQKLEFLTEDTVAQSAPPTQKELQAYLDRHQDQYREEPKLTYEHVFFNREKRGKAAKSNAEAVLAQLKSKNNSRVDLDTLGDAFLLPFKFVDQTGGQIAQLFGNSFSTRLTRMPPGKWNGPIESSYGLHLVRVDEQIPGRVLPLAMVHDTVLRELMSERRQKALDAAYGKLRQRYSVVIEQPTLATMAEKR